VATTAGDLPQTYVIHAAGMGQDLQTSDDLVYLSTKSSLELADDLGLSSVAFPAIGTGVGGLSISECATAMLNAVKEFSRDALSVEEVHFVLFSEEDTEKFERALEE
jgi:O-acetyl-ADP-ribose deacetylase (regulator of RNase III)